MLFLVYVGAMNAGQFSPPGAEKKNGILSPRYDEYEALIMSEIKRLLQHLRQSPQLILDIESGEEFVCSVCQAETKFCVLDPSYRCAAALRGDTELQELEFALRRIRQGTYGLCIHCGGLIEPERLRANPVVQLCSQCAARFSNAIGAHARIHRGRH